MGTTIRKPTHLKVGDTVGVVAPSFPLLPAWRDKYAEGLKNLRRLGFSVKEGKSIGPVRWWGAGTPKDAADDLNSMFADEGGAASFLKGYAEKRHDTRADGARAGDSGPDR